MMSSVMPSIPALRLGVNIDHVATVRQARGTAYPDPVDAALQAIAAGADGITLHLREDRRHIQDHDLERLLPVCSVPVNLEMAVTDEMLQIACRTQPQHVCLVPEKRQERTTEGGLDVAGQHAQIANACVRLRDAGIAVSLFIDPDFPQLQAALGLAPHIEINTGAYAEAKTEVERQQQLLKIADFARAATEAGFQVHAGHGLNTGNVAAIAAIADIVELNIGHALISRALFLGLPGAIAELRQVMQQARSRVRLDDSSSLLSQRRS